MSEALLDVLYAGLERAKSLLQLGEVMVPHAAPSWQHALEQTFIVSRDVLLLPQKAPVHVLERLAETSLTNWPLGPGAELIPDLDPLPPKGGGIQRSLPSGERIPGRPCPSGARIPESTASLLKSPVTISPTCRLSDAGTGVARARAVSNSSLRGAP